MISVGVRELREDLSKWLQRIREEGEIIEVTVRGEAVARLVPMRRKVRSPEEVEKMFEGLDELIEEISEYWPEGVSSVDAVREQRRDL
jgi:prevent-host-death family protein